MILIRRIMMEKLEKYIHFLFGYIFWLFPEKLIYLNWILFMDYL